ncbi:MAG: hypothetical protein WCI20_01105 [bacterium]
MTTKTIFRLALGVVGSVYISALLTLHPSVFWSPDEGAKFIQMHSLLVRADSPHRIAYGAVASDPSFAFYPSQPIYPKPLSPSGVHNHWPVLFPLVSLPFFWIFGAGGLYVLPVTCGLLAAAAAAFLARRLEPDSAIPAVLLAGLGTPLLFQSVLFLEHTLAGALGLGALLFGWIALRDGIRRRPGYSVLTAACLVVLFALRDETLIFVAALACSGLLTSPAIRTRSILRAGQALLPFLLLLALAKAAGDAFGGSSRATDLIGNAMRALDGLKDPALWNRLPRHCLDVLINNPRNFGVPLTPAWAWAGLAGLSLCALSGMAFPASRFRCWFLGASLIAMTSAAGLCLEDRYRAVHGLLLPMPCLVLAWLPTGFDGGQTRRSEAVLTILLPVFLVIYVVTTWVLRRPDGGPEWGLRYAMMAYLLAAVLGSVSVTRFAKASRGWRRPAGVGLAVLLFALSCGYGVRGIIETQVTKRDLQAFEREIRDSGCPVVTDHWWLASALAPTFVSTPLFTLNSRGPIDLWLAGAGAHASEFLYVTYNTPPDVVQRAIGSGSTLSLTRRHVIYNMTFSRYAVQRTP